MPSYAKYSYMGLLEDIQKLEKSKRRSKISWFSELNSHKDALKSALILGVKRTDLHLLLRKREILVPYKVFSDFLNKLEKEVEVFGKPVKEALPPSRRTPSSPPERKSLSEMYKEKTRKSGATKKKFRVASDDL